MAIGKALAHTLVGATVTLALMMALGGMGLVLDPTFLLMEASGKAIYLAAPALGALVLTLVLADRPGWRVGAFLVIGFVLLVLVGMSMWGMKDTFSSPPSTVTAGVGPYVFTGALFMFVMALVAAILELRLGLLVQVAVLYALIAGGAALAFDSPLRMITGVYNKLGFMIMRGLPIRVTLDQDREGRRTVVLTDDWFYCYEPTGEVFMVPRGFESDFASIPWFAQFLVASFGNHAEAAVVHDWLYAVGEGPADKGRLKADTVFKHVMEEKNVNPLKRTVMHAAVRYGGGGAFGRDTEWRFLDPDTEEEIAPPLTKPANAALFRTECETLTPNDPRLDPFRTTGAGPGRLGPGGLTIPGGLIEVPGNLSQDGSGAVFELHNREVIEPGVVQPRTDRFIAAPADNEDD